MKADGPAFFHGVKGAKYVGHFWDVEEPRVSPEARAKFIEERRKSDKEHAETRKKEEESRKKEEEERQANRLVEGKGPLLAESGGRRNAGETTVQDDEKPQSDEELGEEMLSRVRPAVFPRCEWHGKAHPPVSWTSGNCIDSHGDVDFRCVRKYEKTRAEKEGLDAIQGQKNHEFLAQMDETFLAEGESSSRAQGLKKLLARPDMRFEAGWSVGEGRDAGRIMPDEE